MELPQPAGRARRRTGARDGDAGRFVLIGVGFRIFDRRASLQADPLSPTWTRRAPSISHRSVSGSDCVGQPAKADRTRLPFLGPHLPLRPGHTGIFGRIAQAAERTCRPQEPPPRPRGPATGQRGEVGAIQGVTAEEQRVLRPDEFVCHGRHLRGAKDREGPASPRAALFWSGAARGQEGLVGPLQRPVAWRRRCTRAKTPSASPVTAAYSAGSGTAAATTLNSIIK